MALNQFTREWTTTNEGKQIQCKVFEFLVNYISKNKDSKYESVMIELPEIKLSKDFKKEDIQLAVQRLIEIGFLKGQQVSRGINIRITKLGYERWNKRND